MADIIFPQQNPQMLIGDYRLPLTIIDESRLTDYDIGLIDTLGEIAPRTRFQDGDLCTIRPAPHMRRNTVLIGKHHLPETLVTRFMSRGLKIPRVWKIRSIISAWTFDVLSAIQAGEFIYGSDHAHTLLDPQGVKGWEFAQPLIYAHGYPHAMYPNTATYFDPEMLCLLPLREENVVWPEILDEAQTHFVGYKASGNVVHDLAPNLYGQGVRLKHPFRHEEVGTHTAALLGFEEAMMVPISLDSPPPPTRAEIEYTGVRIIDDLDF